MIHSIQKEESGLIPSTFYLLKSKLYAKSKLLKSTSMSDIKKFLKEDGSKFILKMN